MKETTLGYFQMNLAGASPSLFLGGSPALSRLNAWASRARASPDHCRRRTMLSATCSYHVGGRKEKEGKNEENRPQNERRDSALSFLALL